MGVTNTCRLAICFSLAYTTAVAAEPFEPTPANVATLQQKATSGDAQAENTLGNLYSTGDAAPLIPKDDLAALTWFRKAAAQGAPEAAVHLGAIYKHGRGVSIDEAEAVRWYRKAAEQGNARGELMLSTAYYLGFGGVKQDYAAAEKWARRAAEQGDTYAEAALGAMYLRGTGVTKDDKEAVKWWKRSAAHDNPLALTYLGNAYHDGTGVEKNDAEAVKAWSRSAERGNGTGQFYLGLAYMNGWGVRENYVTSYTWLSLASQANNMKDVEKTAIAKALSIAESRLTSQQKKTANEQVEKQKKQGQHEAGPE